MKYLLWAVLLYIAWRWYSAQKHKEDSSLPGSTGASTPASVSSSDDKAESMVRCADCGVHLPLSEALPAPGDLHFCSEAHRARHQAH